MAETFNTAYTANRLLFRRYELLLYAISAIFCAKDGAHFSQLLTQYWALTKTQFRSQRQSKCLLRVSGFLLLHVWKIPVIACQHTHFPLAGCIPQLSASAKRYRHSLPWLLEDWLEDCVIISHIVVRWPSFNLHIVAVKYKMTCNESFENDICVKTICWFARWSHAYMWSLTCDKTRQLRYISNITSAGNIGTTRVLQEISLHHNQMLSRFPKRFGVNLHGL